MSYEDQMPFCGLQQDTGIQQQLKKLSLGEETKNGECFQKCTKSICQKSVCKRQQKKQQNIDKRLKICKKCSKQKGVLLYKGEVTCQPCLFRNLQYKVRLLLENTFKVNKDTNVLLCLSGGLNSICLLDILICIIKRYQKHKLFNKLHVLHIQQQNTIPQNYINHFKQSTGIDIDIIPLFHVLQQENTNMQNVQQIFNKFTKSANSKDLLQIMRDRLILKFAKQNNYHLIIKGFNGQTLASEAFTFFAKGLGGNIEELNASAESGMFHYPLRNHLQKQLQYYYHVKRLAHLAIPFQQDNIQLQVGEALDTHITNFINILQNMYSHTAPAIVRTTQKIQTNCLENYHLCIWCNLKGNGENNLCRRCSRVWQGRKKGIQISEFPEWMQFKL